MSENVERQTMSVNEACKKLGVSRRTIYNWMRKGKVEWMYTPGGNPRIYVDTLLRPTKHKADDSWRSRVLWAE